MKSSRCSICDVTTRAHKKANFKNKKKGVSALKPKKPRSARIRRWDVE